MKTLNIKLDDWTHKHIKALSALKEMTIAKMLRVFVEREISENPAECEFCRRFGNEPNSETKKALNETGGETYSNVEEYFKDLEKNGIKDVASKK
ncbi:MAG: hypothetical protein WA705_20225 [Candidatus Ozemobacteraceae bacterium]